MRILVSLIIDTIPMLSNVLLLGLLIFTVFGIVGVQLWKGLLRNRCFSSFSFQNSSLNESFYQPDEFDFVCSLSNGLTTCADVPSVFSELNYTICKGSDRNPFKNSISFDNIGYAFIAIFQVK